MIVDLTRPMEQSQDLRLLHSILEALVGQPCLKARFAYAGELKLDFGRPVPYSSPKMAGTLKGSWRLGTRASGWRMMLGEAGLLILNDPVEHPEAARGAELTDDQIEAKANALAGKSVIRATPFLTSHATHEGIGLAILLEDGSGIRVIPDSGTDAGDASAEVEAVADWELFTPYHTYLRCGPGFVWSLRRSDVTGKVG